MSGSVTVRERTAYDGPVPLKTQGGRRVDVRIGVIDTAKEIDVDLGDQVDKAAVQQEIEAALASRSESPSRILWLTDRHGRTVGVPAEKIAFIELGADSAHRRVGFVG